MYGNAKGSARLQRPPPSLAPAPRASRSDKLVPLAVELIQTFSLIVNSTELREINLDVRPQKPVVQGPPLKTVKRKKKDRTWTKGKRERELSECRRKRTPLEPCMM